MTLPNYQVLMRPVLQSARNGEIRIGDVVSCLAAELGISEEDRAKLLPSGRETVFSSRVRWARTYLAQAGLIKNTRRSYFSLTERGQNVLKENPARIDKSYLTKFPEFVDFLDRRRPQDAKVSDEAPAVPLSEDQTPDEVIRLAASELEKALRKELLDRVMSGTPAFFEQVVVTLLTEMGFGGSLENAGRKLGKSGDGGVDGVIDQDALGLDSVYVQAKRYSASNPVGSGAIRDFFGSLDRFRATKGVIITTSYFTNDAVETASHLSKRMVLIDGDKLAGLMVRYNVGCRIDETIHLKKVDEDFFDD